MSHSSNVMNNFDFGDKQTPELLIRYQELRAIALEKGDDVETSILSEMVAICGVLRRRSSGPPKQAKSKALPTLEDL